MIDHGDPKDCLVLVDCREVIVPAVIKQGKVIDRSSRNNLGDFSVYNFSGNRLRGLFPDSNPPTLLDQLGNVVFGRMMRNPAHRHASSLGQCDIEKASSLLGILEEHLVKVPESEKQKYVVGK